MLGSIGLVLLRILLGSALITVGLLSARKLYIERKGDDKAAFGAHMKIYFVSYLMIIIGLYIFIKGF